MMNTIWAIVREGRVVPLENVAIPEGTRVLVTLLPEAESDFWLAASESSDDVHAELIEK